MLRVCLWTGCMAVLSAGAAGAVIQWDAAADLTDANATGVWSYGYRSNSTEPFMLDETFELWGQGPCWHGGWYGVFPQIWRNDTTVVQGGGDGVAPGDLGLHPAQVAWCVLRWTAPAEARDSVVLSGYFGAGDSAAPTVSIVKNDDVQNPLWVRTDAGSFNGLTIPVAPGDHIDFNVYGAFYSALTSLNAKVELVPEPATLALLATCAAGLLRRRGKGNCS